MYVSSSPLLKHLKYKFNEVATLKTGPDAGDSDKRIKRELTLFYTGYLNALFWTGWGNICPLIYLENRMR